MLSKVNPIVKNSLEAHKIEKKIKKNDYGLLQLMTLGNESLTSVQTSNKHPLKISAALWHNTDYKMSVTTDYNLE